MNTEIRFQRHELEWTSEKISRFWDFESQNEVKRGVYFTFLLGDALVRLARMNGVLAEPVLDYGAGLGYLTERLVAQGVCSAACDFSPESVESIRRRLSGQSAFLRCELLKTLPSSMPSDTFGTVFLVETLEHLLPEWRESTLHEVWRVLKPGGFVVVTVPNAEPLEAAKVLCADCGAIFHCVQHVATFDNGALSSMMAEYGFTQIECLAMNLRVLTNEMQQRKQGMNARIRRLLIQLRLLAPPVESTPHLVYIGKKAVKP